MSLNCTLKSGTMVNFTLKIFYYTHTHRKKRHEKKKRGNTQGREVHCVAKWCGRGNQSHPRRPWAFICCCSAFSLLLMDGVM